MLHVLILAAVLSPPVTKSPADEPQAQTKRSVAVPTDAVLDRVVDRVHQADVRERLRDLADMIHTHGQEKQFKGWNYSRHLAVEGSIRRFLIHRNEETAFLMATALFNAREVPDENNPAIVAFKDIFKPADRWRVNPVSWVYGTDSADEFQEIVEWEHRLSAKADPMLHRLADNFKHVETVHELFEALHEKYDDMARPAPVTPLKDAA